jgi:ORF6N domain
MSNPHALAERITKTILFILGEKVLLDADLAALYGVDTGTLVRAVKRNIERFPDDFMLQLTEEEWVNLRSQIGISSAWGGRRYAPYAFTEQGVAMLSGVLRSEQAVLVNIEIMRAFVRLREILATHHDLAKKLNNLERKYDSQFKAVFNAIRELMEPQVPKKKPIGFHKGE